MSYNTLSRKPCYRLSTPVRLGVVAVAACFLAAPVLSNPVNPTVVNGVATFNQVGNVLTVTNSNGAIINWDKFSIKVGETTHFAQTSASSSVLNRVLNDPTAIYGTLSSNGRVWLVNPAGIMVGAGGRVDVAGFVASTLNISNADFLTGRNLFVNDGTAKDVINQGQITTPAGGSVYLIGSNVSNEGIITTPNGETILAAGATVSLIDSALPGVKVDITGAEGNSTNLGTITAEAGRIGIAGVIVRNSGTLNASSVVEEGGRIFLKASKDAYVDGNGRIVTTGTKGGSVEVLGDRVAVMDNAEIDASGVNGGGTIKIGGDYQGKNPDIQNASITYLGHNASLKADATEVGDGGTVIVWADDTTRAYGSISARGGATAGNGGFVEVSGKQTLDFAARVNTLAPHGKTGTLLLDPGSMSINDASWLASYQNLSTDLILQTDSSGTGNIDFSGSGAYNTFGHNLTVLAYGGNISVGNITFTDFRLAVAGNLTLTAGWNGASTSTPVSVPTKGDIVLTGSTSGTWIQAINMDVQAGNNLTLTGGGGSGSGFFGPGVMLYSTGTQTVTVGNQILLTAGSFNNISYSGYPQYGGSVVIEALGIQSVTADTITLIAGTGGHDNVAAIRGGGATQDINVTTLLELTGGGGGNNNYANINAFGASTVQTIDATGAAITLTGGASGGVSNQANSADIGLSDTSNFGGSQTVYAGSITIDGGSTSGFAGAGFGTGNGLNQSFYVTGDLTMTGGSADNVDFKATPAYIGSEDGGGTVYMEVGGNITLTGGTGTAGGVLIGSLSSSPRTVTIFAGNNVTIDGGEGGVGIGSIGPVIAAGNMAGGVYIADGASIIADGEVSIYAQNSVAINGILTSGSGVSITAGYSPSAGGYGYYGGSISLGPNSSITGYSVSLLARGYNGLNGDIVQAAGGLIVSTGYSINIAASGNVDLSGTVTASEDINIVAGINITCDSSCGTSNDASSTGGDVFIRDGASLLAGNYANISANSGSASYGGILLEFGGQIYTTNNDITIVSAGNTTLNGEVSAGYQIKIGAGLDPLSVGYGNLPSGIGGDITFGSGSIVRSRWSDGGTAIKAVTYGGSINEGHIIQAAGSQLLVDGYGDVEALAYGDARMDGTTSIAYGGYGIYVNAGAANLGGLSSFYDDGIWGGSNIVSIGSFSAIGGHVEVKAAGAILRSASNLNGINIAADTVSLTSVYGGLAGGIAISAFVEVANSITAEVVSGSTYGGISIANFGAQPSVGISLTDNASDPGSGLGGQPMSISFYNSGDLAIDSIYTTFNTSNDGAMAITSGGNLNYISGLGSIDGGLLLGADGNLSMSTFLDTFGDLKLSAGGVLDVNGSLDGYNIELGAPTININDDVTAANNAALIAPLAGGTINLNAGVTAGGTSATPSYINGIAYSGIAIIAQDVVADGSSAYLDATSVSGDISGLVSGNITLDNGAYFQAGNDIDLVLAGSTSTLSLSNGSYFLADYVTGIPASIKLDFTSRSSGGVLIDGEETIETVVGGSGFFVVDTDTPAREGFGLEIKYASNAATDPCAISPDLCKPPAPNDTPIDDDTPPFGKPDKDKDKKASCEEGSFGCEENQANDGKKDEKPGEKKVAQCSL